MLHLLRNVSTAPVIDPCDLPNAAIFDYLIGNNDAHDKNYSLGYPDKEMRLAPLYDAISTIYYPELAVTTHQIKSRQRISSNWPEMQALPNR